MVSQALNLPSTCIHSRCHCAPSWGYRQQAQRGTERATSSSTFGCRSWGGAFPPGPSSVVSVTKTHGEEKPKLHPWGSPPLSQTRGSFLGRHCLSGGSFSQGRRGVPFAPPRTGGNKTSGPCVSAPKRQPVPFRGLAGLRRPRQTSWTARSAGPRPPELRGLQVTLSRLSEPESGLAPPLAQRLADKGQPDRDRCPEAVVAGSPMVTPQNACCPLPLKAWSQDTAHLTFFSP